jgi:hypothetical protein
MGRFPVDGGKMPVHANLFTIHRGGVEKVWGPEGTLARSKENFEMSSMGWTWVRSGAMRKAERERERERSLQSKVL